MKKHPAFAFPLVVLPALALPLFLPSPPAQAQDQKTQRIYTFKTDLRPLRGKARLVTLKRDTELLHLTVVYPQFLRNTRLTRFANQSIRREAQAKYKGFIKAFEADVKEGVVRKELPYESDDMVFLARYVPTQLISTSVFHGEYRGGAHGMEGTYTTNFGFFPGMAAPKILSLGDLFNGTGYRKEIEAKLLAKMRADKRGVPIFVQDGSVKFLDANQLNNFTISSKGLTWYFPPYQVGPYANGEYELTLSPGELGSNFKRALVLGK